jgi:hypothetical protein
MGEPIKTLKESWWGNLFESNHTENLEWDKGRDGHLSQSDTSLKTWYGWRCYRIVAKCLGINQQIIKSNNKFRIYII